MRPIIIAAGLLLVSLAVLVPTTAEARTVYCTQLRDASGSCPGIVCVDKNLDSRLTYDECIIIYCLDGCCYTMCPPPPM